MTARERQALANALSVAKRQTERAQVLKKRCEHLQTENEGMKAQLRAIFKLSRGVFVDPRPVTQRYDTDKERLEAKRRTWRESKRRIAAEKRATKAAA